MRASRLLQLLMLLQANGRMSATRLAAEVGASVRTIHRDVEALGASGVPVVAERGATGGFRLMEGWRTRLTGLTPVEAHVLASLPDAWQADPRRVVARFHLDPVGWYRGTASVEQLSTVAHAVWDEQRLGVRYDSWKGVSERLIDPLGLVQKGGDWYVVAASTKGIASYKVANIQAAKPTGETFRRPARFELSAWWAESIQRFEAGLYRGTATLRASPRGLKRLSFLSDAVARAVAAAEANADRQGWRRVTIPIESVEHAAAELLRVGEECEVLAPAALRRRLADSARAMTRLYPR